MLTPYLGLPDLGGCCRFDEAIRAGYSVEESVARLKRYHWLLKRTHLTMVGRIPQTAIYELKAGLSYHAYVLAEAITALRQRVGEMREPPLGLDASPDAALDLCCDEVRASESDAEFFVAVHEVLLPALAAALRQHLATTNLLVDQPTARLLRQMLGDVGELAAFGQECARKLVAVSNAGAEAIEWRSDFAAYLAAAGGIDGTGAPPIPAPARRRSATPWQFDGRPRRDARFHDPFNFAFEPSPLQEDPATPAHVQGLLLLIRRIREIDVPEWMAAIMIETPDMPWEYYDDMTRQLWDEMRHGIMGEVGLRRLGIDWTKSHVRSGWSHVMNTVLDAKERHAILWDIEQSLMAKTGKRLEWERAQQTGDALLVTFHDHDWADEVLHAAIGRKWVLTAFANPAEAKAFVERCWEKVKREMPDFVALGWTKGENWWPEFYRHCCAVLGQPVDERIAAFDHRELQWETIAEGRPEGVGGRPKGATA